MTSRLLAPPPPPTAAQAVAAAPINGKSSTVRYLGAKTRVVHAILDLVGPPVPGAFFTDAFTGTGTVAREAARRGWDVRVNDTLHCATIMATAGCLAEADVPFHGLGGYFEALEVLNGLEEAPGFIWREYSPASAAFGPVERMYFTEANAAKIDAVRQQVHTWRAVGTITPWEEALLLGDLIAATSRVANIAGTYGCFLRRWNSNSLQPLQLQSRMLLNKAGRLEVHHGDATLVPQSKQDVVYFDPPYTKRQYAAYYHILETIAHGDEPEVGGVTGLRPWQDRASAYCYKTRALGALTRLVEQAQAQRVFLSYSSEGHVALDALSQALSPFGELRVHELGEIGRYRPNQQASDNADGVHEYLLELDRRGQ